MSTAKQLLENELSRWRDFKETDEGKGHQSFVDKVIQSIELKIVVQGMKKLATTANLSGEQGGPNFSNCALVRTILESEWAVHQKEHELNLLKINEMRIRKEIAEQQGMIAEAKQEGATDEDLKKFLQKLDNMKTLLDEATRIYEA